MVRSATSVEYRRTPRVEGDPDKFIRQVKRKYQARPFDQGQRYELGTFDTRAEARAAILDFWWGRRQELPRFTKRVATLAGPRYIALVPVRGAWFRVGKWFDTREEAGAAVLRFLTTVFGPAGAEAVLKRG